MMMSFWGALLRPQPIAGDTRQHHSFDLMYYEAPHVL
jgi:hypothetical protein